MHEKQFSKIFEQETAKRDIEQIKLPVSKSKLSPVFSDKNIDIHYGVLYKNYVKKSHDGEGAFFTAGAFLHTLFFEQLQEPATPNLPHGEIKELIEKNFETYSKFKEKIIEEALSIKGSGWVYLSKTGSIQTIPNHEKRTDIIFLLDMWEHSYFIDYGADKEKYINSFFRVVNWSTINSRINKNV